jgi:hypothetical protein
MWRSVATATVIACVAFLGGCESKSTDQGGQQPASAEEAQHAEHHEGEGHSHGEDEHAHEGEGHHHEGDDHHGESAHDDESTADDSESSTVSVAENGTKFDPAVEVSRLPDGVWYCEMDKSHYASKTEGDGECPVCGMKLQKKGK